MKSNEAKVYWEHAGEISYAEAIYLHSDIEKHISTRLWQEGIKIGDQLGLNKQSNVLDLGCGDGTFANLILSKHFGSVDGFDLSQAGIKRARELATGLHTRFECCDITKIDYTALPQYEAVYLWGILHHVKDAVPGILSKLHHVTKRIVVLEPNGNNIARKLLEYLPSYKAAGEESFRTKQLESIFKQAGYSVMIWKRLNLFPNRTPKLLFHALRHVEPLIERTPLLRALCTANMWGFIADD